MATPMRPPQVNRTLAKLRAGGVAVGTLSLLPEPSSPELVVAVGYDFFVIDTEHVANDGHTLVHCIRAAPRLAASRRSSESGMSREASPVTLDSGAEGIMIPMVNEAATARRAVELTHYPPSGQRTMCSATRAFGHGAY